MAANWYGIAAGIADPLHAGGLVLCPSDQAPIVLCAIDWCEISNRSHLRWRETLAEAVGTTASRVVVHCIHAHCTPWPDEFAQELISGQPDVVPVMDVAYCEDVLQRTAKAAREALELVRPVTHLKAGKAKVEMVASNRRILGDDGKIKAVRWTKTLDPAVRAEPEGLIDPYLKALSFWDGDEKLAVCHYYAVHPTSYEDGWVTPDFTGLARERREAADGGVPHFYFTECAGDITAGKYNQGERANREVLTGRIQRAMVEAEMNPERVAPEKIEWRSAEIVLPPRPDTNGTDLEAILCDTSLPDKERSRAAIMLAYLERRQIPIEISALHIGEAVSVLHLPGEAFMEYQIFAQGLRPNALVAVPSYGDCGTGYICLERSFAEGGYEPVDSFVAGESEHILKRAIAEVMA